MEAVALGPVASGTRAEGDYYHHYSIQLLLAGDIAGILCLQPGVAHSVTLVCDIGGERLQASQTVFQA